MEKAEREFLIRMIERECKNYYKNISDNEAKGRYEIAKYICFTLGVLSDHLIKELENHMKEQYKRNCNT